MRKKSHYVHRSYSGFRSVGNFKKRYLQRVVLDVSVFTLLLTFSAFSWKFPWKPFSPPKDSVEVKNDESHIFKRFFNETFAYGGFQYSYPEASSVSVVNGIAHSGKVSLCFDLAADDYSGGAVCLQDKVYDLKPVFQKAVLQFWVKGSRGSEKGWVALVDEEKADGHKTVVRVEIDWFGGISTDWSLISIPLEHFGERGVYWDEVKQREVEEDFEWDKVAEFRIEIKKGDNESFRIWVDDIVIVRSLR
jgi:hypothetical protein